MTDKQFKHGALIVAGIGAVIFLILWLLNQQSPATASVGTATPAVTPAQSVAYIPGTGNAIGPVTFPAATYNIPAGPSLGAITPGPSCCDSCNGSGGLNSYSLPSMSSLYQQLGAQLEAAQNAAITALISSMGYPTQVAVSNATPIPGFG